MKVPSLFNWNVPLVVAETNVDSIGSPSASVSLSSTLPVMVVSSSPAKESSLATGALGATVTFTEIVAALDVAPSLSFTV